eukprot:gnl/TRDRNA2_/TRDRNA2_141515_c0_seq2.p2 gnl/TRDRNA2_/TRDRNA2_141515_c0~~gnl/TRDRNA2_/TRDRNA2_141515_c0_seq2.p2  ORF type:complete len:117 (+),score=12.94 gnl/TRDRNA2_/TRDRNA2_141515_c0_seq2:162-512(+)
MMAVLSEGESLLAFGELLRVEEELALSMGCMAARCQAQVEAMASLESKLSGVICRKGRGESSTEEAVPRQYCGNTAYLPKASRMTGAMPDLTQGASGWKCCANGERKGCLISLDGE